jgi:protein-ribulosamine 3-kinase
MMFGEFTSITTINSVIPGLVPAPAGWGKYNIDLHEETYFFLEDYIDMDVTSPPEPVSFTALVAELHRKGTSPNGMFGFPVTTCDGKLPHTVDWEESWSVFFAKLLKGVIKLDSETNGVWPEFERAATQIIDVVIPRLLGVLQSDGRQIKASLIHGDLWEGNIGTDMETGDIIFFDAGSYYAHNEMDLGIWRCEQSGQYLQAKIYSRNYFRNFEAAEPAEECEDRNRLYSLKYNLNYSAGHPGNVTRQT